jgi:hypothetical protein
LDQKSRGASHIWIVNNFASTIHEISFKLHGKKFISNKRVNNYKKALWFNNECKLAKSRFLDAKRIFHLYPSDANKLNFLNLRKEFCLIKRRHRYAFNSKEKAKLSKMSKNEPRKFWKYIKKFSKKNNVNTSQIGMNDFVEHFKNISNFGNNNGNDEDLYQQQLFDTHNYVICEEHDKTFTTDEISKVIRGLKRHKSCDLDDNVADFFIEANDFISPYLVIRFNRIFDTGIYPESWCKGTIVPIYNKGDPTNASQFFQSRNLLKKSSRLVRIFTYILFR